MFRYKTITTTTIDNSTTIGTMNHRASHNSSHHLLGHDYDDDVPAYTLHEMIPVNLYAR